MRDFVRISLETHLFFARIMKEHSLFLEAGFVGKDAAWAREADRFRRQFEHFLKRIVMFSNQAVGRCVLQSEELVTPYTIMAEHKTAGLSGIPIDIRITQMEKSLQCGFLCDVDRDTIRQVNRFNREAVSMLDGLIMFKNNILREVRGCRMFTANYPLLIEHIIREAKLYRSIIMELMGGAKVCYKTLQNQEEFWNRIMMEHALFIRGLLDPSEEALIKTADEFAMEYKMLLKKADDKYCALDETKRLREFKTAGTKGILECQIESLILPLLADHVLREANHYIRILECGYEWREG